MTSLIGKPRDLSGQFSEQFGSAEFLVVVACGGSSTGLPAASCVVTLTPGLLSDVTAVAEVGDPFDSRLLILFAPCLY